MTGARLLHLALGLTLFSSTSALIAQQVSAERSCTTSGRERLVNDSYYDAVLERALRPPQWNGSLISMSFPIEGPQPDWESTLVIRELDQKFEMVRGTIQGNLLRMLDTLDAQCQLPTNPILAADRVTVKWERVELSAVEFRGIYEKLTSALAGQARNARARYQPLLASRVWYMRLHTSQYRVVFQNRFEHIETTVDDVKPQAGEPDPVLEWIHSLIKLSEERFQGGKGAGKRSE